MNRVERSPNVTQGLGSLAELLVERGSAQFGLGDGWGYPPGDFRMCRGRMICACCSTRPAHGPASHGATVQRSVEEPRSSVDVQVPRASARDGERRRLECDHFGLGVAPMRFGRRAAPTQRDFTRVLHFSERLDGADTGERERGSA